MIAGGEKIMASKISDGATFEEVQALLLKCTRQLRNLMPPGADLSHLDRTEAEQDFLTWMRQTPLTRSEDAQAPRFP
jgi:hypothetical protein